MAAKRKTPKRKPYVSPTRAVLDAVRQTEAMKHETYSFQLMLRIQEHNHTVLLPALEQLFDWTREIDRETKKLQTKWIRSQLAKLPPEERKRVAAELRKATGGRK